MSKILKFRSDDEITQEELIEHLEKLVQWAKDGEFDNVLIATKMNSGEIMTGYCNLDLGDKQNLISHLQIDVNFETIKANVDQLIEWVEE